MSAPEIAGRKPILVTLARKGDRVLWCACGRSQTQPFCDGSHKGTGFRPVPYAARRDNEEALLCACKRTQGAPFCDGSHNNLADVDAGETQDEIAAAESLPLAPRSAGAHGRADLDGGCYVLRRDPATARARAGWRSTEIVGRAAGARHLGQYALAASRGAAPIGFGSSEVLLFVAEGAGAITIGGPIGGRRFAVAPECAIAVRPGEALAFSSDGDAAIVAIATVCPYRDDFEIYDAAPEVFDAAFPERVGRVDQAARKAMGERFYQVLADRSLGAGDITQFIGEIPKSRAAPHRHLYEEALLILAGEGFMRTETKAAAVGPGDVIFLPAKQLHALDCVSGGGMRLAGAFYPSGSPAINY